MDISRHMTRKRKTRSKKNGKLKLKLNSNKTRTQKAGGIGYLALNNIEEIIKANKLVENIYDKLFIDSIERQVGSGFFGFGSNPNKKKLEPKSKKPSDNLPKSTQSKEDYKKDKPKIDKNKATIMTALHKYILRVIKHCYKKMSKEQRKVFLNGKDKNKNNNYNIYTDAIAKYLADILFNINITGANNDSSNGLVLLNSKLNTINYNGARIPYTHNTQYPTNRSRNTYALDYVSEVKKQFYSKNSINEIESGIRDVITYEKTNIIDELHKMSNHTIPFETNAKNELTTLVDKLLFTNKRLDKIIVIPPTIKSTVNINCSEIATNGAIFLIIDIVTNAVDVNKYYVINCKISEAKCYVDIIKKMTTQGNAKTMKENNENGKKAIKSLLNNILLKKSLTKNNGTGLYHYIIRRLNMQPQT